MTEPTQPAMAEPEFDVDGYPTDATLKAIEAWEVTDRDSARKLFEFVRRAWKYPDCYEEFDGRYYISTGGWSGNESLIKALPRWAFLFYWQWSRTGGHYCFDLEPYREIRGDSLTELECRRRP